MSDSEAKRPKRKEDKASREKKAARRRVRAQGRRLANLIKALDHRVRRRILRLAREKPTPLSPVALAKELDEPLGTVSYHVSVLSSLGALKKTGERQVRGAVEHFYEPTVDTEQTIEDLLEGTRERDDKS